MRDQRQVHGRRVQGRPRPGELDHRAVCGGGGDGGDVHRDLERSRQGQVDGAGGEPGQRNRRVHQRELCGRRQPGRHRRVRTQLEDPGRHSRTELRGHRPEVDPHPVGLDAVRHGVWAHGTGPLVERDLQGLRGRGEVVLPAG